MFTKQLTPTGKIFTKQVAEFLEEMFSEANPVTVALYSKKAIHECWTNGLFVEDSSVRLIVHESLINDLPVEVLEQSTMINKVSQDLSNKIMAIFYSESEGYLMISRKDIIAGTFDDNPKAAEFIEKSIRMIGRLK